MPCDMNKSVRAVCYRLSYLEEQTEELKDGVKEGEDVEKGISCGGGRAEKQIKEKKKKKRMASQVYNWWRSSGIRRPKREDGSGE